MSLTSSPSLYREKPQLLIDNRLGIGGDDLQLSLYSFDTSAERVHLRAPHMMYYGMIEGRQLVHVDGEDPFAFEEGESLVVPPLQTIVVEFPNAHRTSVEYLALKVNQEKVHQILDRINEVPLESSAARQWKVEEEKYCHVENRQGVDYVLEMVEYLFRADPPNRDRLIELNARELLIQMLQSRSRSLLVGDFSRHTSAGGLAAAVQYIQKNLDRHISIDELVEEACMSKSTFYRHFSDEFDMSPLEYISQERVVRARELLADEENTVTSVSHALGFSSTSHFIDMFKEHEGMTPKQYQLEVLEAE